MFGLLSNLESLRNLIVALEAHQDKAHHLRLGKHVYRSRAGSINR